MSKFKVGDRVKCVVTNDKFETGLYGDLKNKEGTILEISPKGYDSLIIEFDNIGWGWNRGSRRDNNCWGFTKTDEQCFEVISSFSKPINSNYILI